MSEFMHEFAGYVSAVFVESWRWIGFVFDILGLLLICTPASFTWLTEDVQLARAVGGAVALVSFVCANFLVYRELHVEGADIRLSVEEQSFNPSAGTWQPGAFRHIKRGYLGFNQQGLPDWASLYARIKLANFGFEEGTLLWEVDKSKTSLPELFDLDHGQVSFYPRATVPARRSLYEDLFFSVLWTVEDPGWFALALKELVERKRRYKLVLRYRTKRVDSETRARQVVIEGDFRALYESVLEHWAGYGHEELVDLARIG